jgi:small subunit ribosomal protein S16
MVKLRLKRTGRRHQPFYRIVAVDLQARRDGEPIEELGYYDPRAKDAAKQVVLNPERAAHWLNAGAQPSETVAKLLKKAGVSKAAPVKA